MPDDTDSQKLSGQLQQLLYSPRGTLEGLLLNAGSSTIQISMEPSSVAPELLAKAIGSKVELKASLDRSHKARAGAHPVYKLEALEKLQGRPVPKKWLSPSISGVVAAIHYAKHGEPNGVILASGDFIHTRPPGMKKLRLDVGSRVVASGEVRMTVLGTRLSKRVRSIESILSKSRYCYPQEREERSQSGRRI